MQVEISASNGRLLRSSHGWQDRGEVETDFQLTGQSVGRQINKMSDADGRQHYVYSYWLQYIRVHPVMDVVSLASIVTEFPAQLHEFDREP